MKLRLETLPSGAVRWTLFDDQGRELLVDIATNAQAAYAAAEQAIQTQGITS